MEQKQRKLPNRTKPGQTFIEVPDKPTSFDPRQSLTPETPLTKEERDFIFKTRFTKCCRAYISRIIVGSGLGHVEDGGDTRSYEGSAFLFFSALCDKFDKTRYRDRIASENTEGANNSKTIDWYFYVYFCEKLNELAKEMKEKNKKHKDLYGDDISVEWVLNDVSAERHKYYRQTLEDLLNDSSVYLSEEAQKLLSLRFTEGYKSKEAKDLIGKSYYAVRTEMMNYINIYTLRKRVELAALLEVSENDFYRKIERRLRGRDMKKILSLIDRYTSSGSERRELRRYVRGMILDGPAVVDEDDDSLDVFDDLKDQADSDEE